MKIMDATVYPYLYVMIATAFGAGLSDPCSTATTLPRAAYRGGQCSYDANKPVCDSRLPAAWYRANTSTVDIKIQTSLPNINRCGTKFPYWMNGTLPVVSDIVNRTVCAMTTRSSCQSGQQIQVKNCGTFFVYNLTALPTCDEGYCFGESDDCPPYDPCDIYEHTELTFDKDQRKVCDIGDECRIDNSKWYRFNGGQDITSILNQTYSNCSSDSLTSASNGITNHTLCVHVKNNPCSETVHTYSKQCNGFSVYKLPKVIGTTCKRICIYSQHRWNACQIPPPLHKNDNGVPLLQGNVFLALILVYIISNGI